MLKTLIALALAGLLCACASTQNNNTATTTKSNASATSAAGKPAGAAKTKPAEPPTPACPKLTFDPSRGTLNGLSGKATREAIKRALPCSSGETPDGKKLGGIEINCGGGVFFLKHDFYFYTGRDYIEIRAKFKGESGGMLGATRKSIEAKLGQPNRVVDDDGKKVALYALTYGTLVVTYKSGAAVKLAAHLSPAQDVKLCL